MTRFLLICLFLISGNLSSVWADEAASIRKIEAYKRAAAKQEEDKIKQTWQAIEDDPAAAAYLEEHDPRLFNKFKLQGLVYRAERLNQSLGDNILDPTPRIIGGTPARTRQDNSDVPRSQLNQNKPPNIERVQALDNRERALLSPNQDRIPIQDTIRARRERQ